MYNLSNMLKYLMVKKNDKKIKKNLFLPYQKLKWKNKNRIS